MPLGALAEIGGEEVAQIASQAASNALARGAAWSSAPAAAAALLAVEDGFVVISADTVDGSGDHHGGVSRRIIVATGQSGMLLAAPAPSERLEALTSCQITVISPDSLKGLLGLPPVAEVIAHALVEALRERQATILNCAPVRHSARVRGKLLQLARTYGRVVPGGVRIDFPLTHQLLADMIGSARETVSLALSDLAREGLLHRQDRAYVLRIASHELFTTE